MSELSHEKIVDKLEIVPDPASFSGYSIIAFDKSEGRQPGIPASPFEIALYKENVRLRNENEKLRTFIKEVYDIGNNTDYVYATETMLEMLKVVALSEDLPVAA